MPCLAIYLNVLVVAFEADLQYQHLFFLAADLCLMLTSYSVSLKVQVSITCISFALQSMHLCCLYCESGLSYRQKIIESALVGWQKCSGRLSLTERTEHHKSTV
jgi:hypothetical protein